MIGRRKTQCPIPDSIKLADFFEWGFGKIELYQSPFFLLVIRKSYVVQKFAPDKKQFVEHVPWIIGSPSECVQQLHELRETVGGFGTLLFNSREWVTVDRWYRSLELFARYVSPHFRALDDQRFRAELAEDALGG